MITTKRQKIKGFKKISPIFHSKVDAQNFLDNVERRKDCRSFFRIVNVPKVYPCEYYIIAKYEEYPPKDIYLNIRKNKVLGG